MGAAYARAQESDIIYFAEARCSGIEDRKCARAQDNPVVAAALAQVDWTDIQRITGITAWGEQVLFRLKQRASSVWDATRGLPGCPVDKCLQRNVIISHTFWSCVGAVRPWDVFYAPWTALGLRETPSRIIATFKLELELVPQTVLMALDEHYSTLPYVELDLIRHHVHGVLQDCWRIGAVETLKAIWRRRCLYRKPREDCSAARAAAVLRGRLRAGYHLLRAITKQASRNSHCQAAADLVCHVLAQPSVERARLPAPTRRLQTHLLLFNGGSRRNPGPGGSRSVIVRLGGAAWVPELVWMARVSYDVRTTNNAAEYQGILHGLRYAARNKIYELNVAGDSNVVLTQLRRRRVPKARHLKGVYMQRRQLADRLIITSWTHHVRQFNKLADRLANIAMDSRTSTQVFPEDLPTLPTYWATAVESLQGGVDHWLDLHSDTEDDGRSPNIYGVD